MQLQRLGAVALAVTVILAGCSGGLTGERTTDGETTSVVMTSAADDGVTFYVSDEENAIEDFEHLNVTITEVGFQQAEGGWVERDVDDRTVDLTRLQGANATRLTSIDAPNGTYTKVFAHVSEVDATLTTGESQEVKLPSEKLQLNTEFTVGNDESVDFVFDITVHEAGNSGKYILQPVVSESGTDVPIDPIDDELDVAFVDEDSVAPGGNATLEVTDDDDDAPVANATVDIDGEQVGTTGADGRVTVPIPDADQFTLTVTAGETSVAFDVAFEQDDDESELEAEEQEDEGDEEDEEDEEDEDEEAEDEEEQEEDEEDDAEADDDEADAEEEESADDEADEEDDDEDEREVTVESEGLNATFVGEVVRGQNATVSVTADGEPVANATVEVDGEDAGTTDADGLATFVVPEDDELTVELTEGEREAELEVEFADE